jgi:lipopolysaccharide export LptBFGC system permease protein LptF
LLGVALTLLPRSSRTNRSWGFALCLFWLVVYYGLLSLGKAAGEKGLLPPALALWLPNIVITAISVHLFSKALRESPVLLPAKMEAMLLSLGHRFAPSRRPG